MHTIKTGLLLINLGTPQSPSTRSVRRYLRQFLSDDRVIDLPKLIQQLLLNLVILPFRPKQSAKAYQAIWTDEGSPLLVLSQQLKKAVRKRLGDTVQVELAMRYGEPTIAHALTSLADCDQLLVLPLYPQYASSSTGSSIEAVLEVIKKQWTQPHLIIQRDFFDHPSYIDAQAACIKPYMNATPSPFLLLSYHGLPERHLHRGQCQPICEGPCPAGKPQAKGCYRSQCYDTSRLLANKLQLNPDQYTSTFQSRLGRTPWIQPYTDEHLAVLIKRGIKHLVVACPSFVTDCLETLEEIGMQAKETWEALGGESFKLIPCLNDDKAFVEFIAKLTKERCQLPK